MSPLTQLVGESSFPLEGIYIWRAKEEKHSAYIRERHNLVNLSNWSHVEPKSAYDLFEPEWNCEDEIRLGTELVSIGEVTNLA